MKYKKAIALLLIASMTMSMTGCSGNKKQILTLADEYAQAVISGDMDDISEFMKDDEDFLEGMEISLDKYTSVEDLEDVYDIIFDSMSYEIDKKSLYVSDKKASIEIAYTMVDYLDVYDDLDDDAELEDYIDALEDAEDDTMTIKQEVQIKLIKDEWKIVDPDNESLLEVYEFYPEIYDLGFCGILELTIENFQQVCEDVFEDDDPYYFDGNSFDDCTGYGYGAWADLSVYTNQRSAVEDFTYYSDMFQEMVANGEFDGTISVYSDDHSGYIVFDGYVESSSSFFTSGDVYGGIFFSEGSFMIVISSLYDDSTKDMIDEFLEALGCPTPREQS